MIGAYAIAFGVIMAGGAFWLPLDGSNRAPLLFSGLVSILFGIVMFANPGAGALVTLALIAAFALVIGLSEVVLAIGGKRLVETRLNRVMKEAVGAAEEGDRASAERVVGVVMRCRRRVR